MLKYKENYVKMYLDKVIKNVEKINSENIKSREITPITLLPLVFPGSTKALIY